MRTHRLEFTVALGLGCHPGGKLDIELAQHLRPLSVGMVLLQVQVDVDQRWTSLLVTRANRLADVGARQPVLVRHQKGLCHKFAVYPAQRPVKRRGAEKAGGEGQARRTVLPGGDDS